MLSQRNMFSMWIVIDWNSGTGVVLSSVSTKNLQGMVGQPLTGSQLPTEMTAPQAPSLTIGTKHSYHWDSMTLSKPANKLSFLVALLDGENILEECM